MLIVFMLNVFILNSIMLSVVIAEWYYLEFINA
jgi:hypothetical protein